jgi:hypothetical protein
LRMCSARWRRLWCGAVIVLAHAISSANLL